MFFEFTMKKNKINKKACLNCGLEAAVARKVCSGCNTPFYSKRPTYFYERKDSKQGAAGGKAENCPSTSGTGNGSSLNTNEENCRRRTERVKREKPHFYDASEFQSQSKKKKNEKNIKCTNKQNKAAATAAQVKKVENKRLKKHKLCDSLIELEEQHMYENFITPRKSEQLAIILQELNSKLTISSWKP